MYQKTTDLMMDPVREGFREIWKGGGAAKAALILHSVPSL